MGSREEQKTTKKVMSRGWEAIAGTRGKKKTELDAVWKATPRENYDQCDICTRRVNSGEDGVLCELGRHWNHRQCQGMSESTYRWIGRADKNVKWFCDTCERKVDGFAEGMEGMKTRMKEMDETMKKWEANREGLQKEQEVAKKNLKEFEEECLKEIKKEVEKMYEEIYRKILRDYKEFMERQRREWENNKLKLEEIREKMNEMTEREDKIGKVHEKEIKKLKEEVVERSVEVIRKERGEEEKKVSMKVEELEKE